jgi:predicted ATPase/class 3 adenylate cyclase
MTSLPSGTVTFLFTDIEASTARWEHDPAAMRTDLARHDSILRRSIEEQSGVVIKTVGDAFYAVFPAAVNAIAAALMAQRALGTERWTGAAPLRVRMALHAGEAELRDGDYFGPALARVARLLAVAHGGQVLLTGSVEALAHDRLPARVSLRDLGEHRLRDLSRRERIYQLVASGLLADFPPLRTSDARPTNLTTPPTVLIGRAQEIETARTLIVADRVRLVTLTGPGGTGKTRLALELGARLADRFADGVFFVPLDAITEPAFVPAAVAATLGVREAQGRPVEEVLADYLHGQEMLLILDNFEQVIGAAPFVAGLIARCPRLAVVVTSRERLRLRGEHELPVPPLSLTEFQVPSATFQEADTRNKELGTWHSDAVRLFVERAREVRPGFGLTDGTAAIVHRICERVDGLPLAIELAAARIRMLSPAALLERLGERADPATLRLLQSGARDLPARQQTLWNTIDWSYGLLDAQEQALFRRLSVFAGGCTVAAAAALSAAVGTAHEPATEASTLDRLSSLADKSLLLVGETADGEPRLNMLETLRAYGLEQLRLSGELDGLRRAHAACMLERAEAADAGLGTAEARRWRARLEEDQDNLRASLRWACDSAATETAARLIWALHQFWFIGGWLSEGLRWCEEVLALPGLASDPAWHARVLFVAGRLAGYQGDQVGARARLDEAIALSRAAGDRLTLGRALAALGRLLIEEPEQARPVLEESLDILRDLGDHRWLASALGYLGAVARRQGYDDAARVLFEESLALAHEAGDPWAAAAPLANLAALLDRHGDVARARSMYEDSLRRAPLDPEQPTGAGGRLSG